MSIFGNMYQRWRGPAAGDPPSLPAIRGYDMEVEAREAITQVAGHTMVPYPRLVTLFQQAAHCELTQLAGAFVECGTWKGGGVGIMAQATLRYGKNPRALHLFDSFVGIPEPDAAVDGSRAVSEVARVGGGSAGRLRAVEGFYETYANGTGTLADNKRLLEGIIGYPSSMLHYHEGWFQDTVPQAATQIGDIAILRLDGDWYASTKVCLEHLCPHVVAGGIVIIDDYGAYEGCRKAVDEYRQGQGLTEFMHHLDQDGRYWIKR